MSSLTFTTIAVFFAACFLQTHSFPTENVSVKNSSTPIKPVLRIYNRLPPDQTFTIEVSQNIPIISPYRDDLNDIAGYCATGTWLAYGFSNYTSGGVGGLIYSNDTQTCTGRQWPSMSSFRFVGSPTDIHVSSFSTYAYEGYRDTNIVYFNDTANIAEPFNSLIITGNQPVTIYSAENYQGFSICIDAPQNGLGGGLRNLVTALGLQPGEIKSFRFICATGAPRVSLERNSG